jgi:prepilin-type N-terminal cleavage/methylation domain-containing protein
VFLLPTPDLGRRNSELEKFRRDTLNTTVTVFLVKLSGNLPGSNRFLRRDPGEESGGFDNRFSKRIIGNPMPSPDSQPSWSEGFTLIELLTVIAIVSVLIGLLFPATAAVRDVARKAKAKNDLVQLVTATRAYYSEYGRYPSPSAEAGRDSVFSGGEASNADLCNILRAVADDDQLNPRQIIFLEAPPAKKSGNSRGGIGKDGTFFDPWGNEYVVFVDSDYDHSLTKILGRFYSGEDVSLRVGVAAVSPGKDGKWGTNGNGKLEGSDDVVSWQ